MISKKNKIALCIFHDYMCEECKLLNKGKKLKLSEIEIHKINPKKGYSDHRNLKVCCKKHHEIFSSAQRIALGVQGR